MVLLVNASASSWTTITLPYPLSDFKKILIILYIDEVDFNSQMLPIEVYKEMEKGVCVRHYDGQGYDADSKYISDNEIAIKTYCSSSVSSVHMKIYGIL